jgi:raffinose/stachyose/melibiose transport system permease protein
VTGRLDRFMTYTILLVFSVIALVPLLMIILEAMHPAGELQNGFSFPTSLNFDTFRQAWTVGQFGDYLINSLIVAVAVVISASSLSVLSGYALGAMDTPFRDWIFYLFLIGLVVPFEAMIVPLYYNFRDLGLTETYWALILPQLGLSLSFGTFWMRAFFLSAPTELVEAARIDGARSFTVLWRVLMPLAKPAVTTMMVLLFLFTWNEFLLALVMVDASDSHRTAPLGLSNFQGRYSTDIPSLAAGAVIVALPVVIVYLFLQRQFIRGMLSGALKA